MTTNNHQPDDQSTMSALRLAPEVSYTRLPFGGCVLVHGQTLDLLECGPREAEVVHALLTRSSAAVHPEMADDLVTAGWAVLAAPTPKG